MDIRDWDGTLSSTDFRHAACALVRRWERLGSAFPSWSWMPCSLRPQTEGYLSLERVCLRKPNWEECSERSSAETEDNSGSNDDEPLDNATLKLQNDHQEEHYYDVHVVFSESYKVPVLYFRGYYLDGQPLPFDVIERNLPSYSAKIMLENKWTFITQEEHPYLQRPWYKLHPCGTSERMKLLFASGASLAENDAVTELYLASWLSFAAQAVGLRIPSEILKMS